MRVARVVPIMRSNTTKAYAHGPIQMAMAHNSSRACAHCPTSYTYTSPMEDLATFLLVRGAYGWLGAGWAGCNAYPTYYAPFEQDYGVPVDSTYSETRHKSGVFVRNWTKARVSFDCNSYKGTIAAI